MSAVGGQRLRVTADARTASEERSVYRRAQSPGKLKTSAGGSLGGFTTARCILVLLLVICFAPSIFLNFRFWVNQPTSLYNLSSRADQTDVVHFACDEFVSEESELGDDEDSELQRALGSLCKTSFGPDLLRVVVHPNFVLNYERIFHTARRDHSADSVRKSAWIDEAFVNYFADDEREYHYDRTAMLIRSVHEFSTRPIIVFYVSKEKTTSASKFATPKERISDAEAQQAEDWNLWDTTISASRFPRLVVFQVLAHEIAGASSEIGINFNKFRSMLLSKTRAGLQVDSDALVYVTADRLFQRAREVDAPYPVSPVHWMSRDPESDDFRDEPRWTFHLYDGIRTMRWVHAHPTWTYKALPYLGSLYTGVFTDDSHITSDLLRGHLKSDERALNVYYWDTGANKQWCKYDIFPGAYKHFFTQDADDMSFCCTLADSKWYPHGIAIVFSTVHALQNQTEAVALFQELQRHKSANLPHIYFAGRFYSDASELPPNAARPCLI